MPKISKRRTQLEPPARHQTTIMTQVRKISFEDSSMPSSPGLSSFHSSSSSGSLPRTSCCRTLDSSSSKQSLMRRRTPSVCLSQLALVNVNNNTSPTSHDQDNEDERCLHSPMSTASSSDESCSSPWGQFVDVIPSTPEEEESDDDSQSYDRSACKTSLQLSNSQHSYQPYYKPRRSPIRKSPKCFLPGFILSIPTPTKPSNTDDIFVLRALKRMQV
mmetsp:Transcript_30319/g.50092  ORF Transcript_30319/g.50092 Transcript_30319/m.50092 type:complete len:217 (-) Transcript_30319:135-785(-)|eukprot:CAMPEP_0119015022 /NCGR_PEP_ID=MMETSP1176-20130426/10514_1 /TAXON_ID=265551 /ORGANISM="Synedropsis recta cf, Strain CCMP1620" /LENGTH=216 /DNA_ID=CAMNT_0006968281 /DNA_START=134 /DNA_END=784 /DNA_ORIENTATION=+